MGHITLAASVAHNWYVKGAPSKLSLVLDLSLKSLEAVIYFASFLVTEVDEQLRTKAFEKLEKERQISESKLQQLIDFVDPEKARIPDTGSEAGLFFIERLHSSIKKISDQHDVAALKLPENLGFGGGLPKEGMVDVLLRQLETVEVALGVLLKKGNVEFYAIKPLKSIEYRDPFTKEIFYSELPVQISVKTDTDTLINLLVELKNATPVVSVKELHIKSGQAGTKNIEASFVLSTFSIVRSLE